MDNLEDLDYRQIQAIAKELGINANVKKETLIQQINEKIDADLKTEESEESEELVAEEDVAVEEQPKEEEPVVEEKKPTGPEIIEARDVEDDPYHDRQRIVVNVDRIESLENRISEILSGITTFRVNREEQTVVFDRLGVPFRTTTLKQDDKMVIRDATQVRDILINNRVIHG